MSPSPLVPTEQIARLIHSIRGHKVMLDADLARLYGVTTGALNQAVRRNRARFPHDFMFQLSRQELQKWKSQIVISNPGATMGLRKPPSAFTEQGVAMLSSVLRSERAAQVNVAIMRAFVRLRALIASSPTLARRLDELERRTDSRFRVVFQVLAERLPPKQLPPKRRIGFIEPKPK